MTPQIGKTPNTPDPNRKETTPQRAQKPHMTSYIRIRTPLTGYNMSTTILPQI